MLNQLNSILGGNGGRHFISIRCSMWFLLQFKGHVHKEAVPSGCSVFGCWPSWLCCSSKWRSASSERRFSSSSSSSCGLHIIRVSQCECCSKSHCTCYFWEYQLINEGCRIIIAVYIHLSSSCSTHQLHTDILASWFPALRPFFLQDSHKLKYLGWNVNFGLFLYD